MKLTEEWNSVPFVEIDPSEFMKLLECKQFRTADNYESNMSITEHEVGFIFCETENSECIMPIVRVLCIS